MRTGVRIGVDVGSVRVGLAASDPSGLLASPVATVPRDSGETRADVARIAGTARDLGAVEIVVGLPRLLSGAEGEAARLARAYALELSLAVSPTPVRLVDERLTTVESHRRLRESGVAGRSQRGVVDQTAAVLILQSALDAERASGRAPGTPVAPQRRRPRTKDRG
ncbi:MAG: Holliday junction resolvase RuvX [Actinomycetota bacterium]|nr:Holliday junction resolvase RuvX [Actinomycetota bacterium]